MSSYSIISGVRVLDRDFCDIGFVILFTLGAFSNDKELFLFKGIWICEL